MAEEAHQGLDTGMIRISVDNNGQASIAIDASSHRDASCDMHT